MDIKINIEDERFFLDVAPVVDRPDFSKEIERIRKKVGLNRVLSKDDSAHFIEIFGIKKYELLPKEVEKSRKRLLLPVVFKTVIEEAAICGEVNDDDYKPAYLDFSRGAFDNEENTLDDTYFIVLSPGVRDEDVLKALWKYRDESGNLKGIPDYKYIHQIWETNIKKPSIKKYRKWYLAIKSGDSYPDVCTEESDSCPIIGKHSTGKDRPKNCTHFDESTIRKGVATYESLIWKTPTL